MRIATREFGNSKVFRCSIKKEGYKILPHIHQHLEMLIILQGSVEITINSVTQIMQTGQMCIISPFQIHKIRALKNAEFWMSVFSPSCIPDWQVDTEDFFKTESLIFTPEPSFFSYVKGCLPMSINDSVIYFDDMPREIKSALYASFTEYFKLAKASESIRNNGALSALILYVSEHFREDINLITVSHALGYNSKYLSQCLSVLPDITFSSLLNSCRIELAKTMLIGTDLKIVEVAYECGYKEERTFRRAFQGTVGLKPSEYRTMQRNQRKLKI